MIKIKDCDLFFLSYDEPNAEENWIDLKFKYSKAKRIHGIKGFDKVHRLCATNSETQYFVTIDGDNIVYPEFFLLEIEEPENIIWWSSRNKLNNLIYGNGGIKLWNKDLFFKMKSHNDSIDFDFSKITFKKEIFSDVIITGSQYQAWRSGFREAIKLSVFRKKLKQAKKQNERLKVWCNTGIEKKNGEWVIYGARLGCYLVFCTNWNFRIINNYNLLQQMWENEISKKDPKKEMKKYARLLKQRTNLVF